MVLLEGSCKHETKEASILDPKKEEGRRKKEEKEEERGIGGAEVGFGADS